MQGAVVLRERDTTARPEVIFLKFEVPCNLLFKIVNLLLAKLVSCTFEFGDR